VAESLGYDRVILIPSANPPHKVAPASLADSAHRLAMLRIAVADDSMFAIDDLELSRAGPSYTIDTARILAGRGEGPIHWLIGADMLLYLPNWHNPAELLREVKFLIMARPGWLLDWTLLPAEYRHLAENVVAAPVIDISATAIRARVAQGKSIRYLTPGAVCEYIEDNGLYR
jgi:nicotinate-nucleotide adenylyltransferase